MIICVEFYHYLRSSKLASWIGNIVENEAKKKEYFLVDNTPRTHCPQDLFTALNHQFAIATKELRAQCFVDVIAMILASMVRFKELLQAHIEAQLHTFEDEYLCALLNSCYDVSQKLKAKSDAILDASDLYDLSPKQTTKLDDAFEDRICMFTNMGKLCALLLAAKVYKDELRDKCTISIEFERLGEIIRSDECFGDQDEFIDVSTLWDAKSEMIHALHGVLDCDAAPVEENQKYEQELMTFVRKLRRKN